MIELLLNSLMATMTATLLNVSFDSVLALPVEAPEQIEFYGDGEHQFGELWLPEGQGPFPLVVLLHGGCWLNSFDVVHSRPLSNALRNQGYGVWAIEYRRLGDPGGGWPGTFEDIATGVDFIATLGERYPLDLQHPVIMGHSAGGQLALWAAARGGFPLSSPFFNPLAVKFRQVIGLAAVADLATYAMGSSSCERAALQLLEGTPAEQAERYGQVSPLELHFDEVDLVLLQGAADQIVPAGQGEVFAAGHPLNSVLETVKGAGHFDFIHPGTGAFERILAHLPLAVEE